MVNAFERLKKKMAEPETPQEKGVVLATGAGMIIASVLPTIGPEGALKMAQVFSEGVNPQTPWVVATNEKVNNYLHPKTAKAK